MIELADSPVFRGFTASDWTEAYGVLAPRIVDYPKDGVIYLEGQLVPEMGVVLSGSVTIERVDYLGNKNILGYSQAGQVFAEVYALLQKPLMIDVAANEPCRILFVNLKNLPRGEGTPWHEKLVGNLLQISSRKNLQLSERSFHTAPRQIRGRVLSYLGAMANERQSREFDLPLNRQQMADYLNLDRSALSNELSKMRDEGIIEFHRNHFKLL